MAKKSFCVIGLGSFGKNLALTLAKGKNQVLVIDNNEITIDDMAPYVTNAVCGDPTNESVLRAAGVASFDCCVVCLSDNMQDSTLVTLMLKEIGIKKVVARAASDLHKRVLLKVGADMVVFPEQDMGNKLASTLSKTDVFEFINLSKDYSIVEIKAPKKWVGKNIRDLNVRQKYGVNIIAMQDEDSEGDNFAIFTDPSRIIRENEMLVIIGGNEDIDKLTKS